MKTTSFLKRSTSLNRGTSTLRASRIKHHSNLKDDTLWPYTEADSKFSKYIRQRDKRCLNCLSTYLLTCSHYHGRSTWSTRFDPDNCITLCQECHTIWEAKKKTVYTEFMIMFLGNARFSFLDNQSKLRMSREESVQRCMNLIERSEKEIEINY